MGGNQRITEAPRGLHDEKINEFLQDVMRPELLLGNVQEHNVRVSSGSAEDTE